LEETPSRIKMNNESDLYIPVFDAAAIGSVLLLFSLYLIVYQARVRSTSGATSTQTGRNFQNLILWGEKHSKFPDAPSVTLAVQTMRNTILVGIFVGGSSLTAAISSLDLFARPGGLPPQLVVRQLIVSGLLFLSFLNWAQVIRYSNHISYYVGTLASHEQKTAITAANPTSTGICGDVAGDKGGSTTLTVEGLERRESQALREVKIYSLKMASHFSFGFRFIFFCIPFWFYAAGPVALIVSSGLMISFLVFFDFPNSMDQKED